MAHGTSSKVLRSCGAALLLPTLMAAPHERTTCCLTRSSTHTYSRTLLTHSYDTLIHVPLYSSAQIKKRIEDLIAREYLERDANNPNLYKYLA